jgi:hypothetical protein
MNPSRQFSEEAATPGKSFPRTPFACLLFLIDNGLEAK